MVWALLPLKDFTNAKQRLSAVLSADERHQVFQAMVEDVLTVLASHPGIEQTIIVSDDPEAELLAARYKVLCWSESALSAFDLNSSVSAAAIKLADMDVTSMLVVHGDLPLLNAAEIQTILDQHQPENAPIITIVPDENKDGSNCLLVSPPNCLPFNYGVNSFDKHVVAAGELGISYNVLELAGAAQDIDNAADLERLVKMDNIENKTIQYLRYSKIVSRFNSKNETPNFRLEVDQKIASILDDSKAGKLPSDKQSKQFALDVFSGEQYTAALMATAAQLRDKGFRNVVTYSRKVFIPLTHLCRDVCHYCTFAQTPKNIQSPYMSVEQVLTMVRAGVEQGCKEALFTLGEKPELRYSIARKALAEMGFQSTLEYVAHVAKIVFDETGILPHINAGCMSGEEIALLRPVSASMGIMLESASNRLCEKGMPHYGSPDKIPAVRLQTVERAGKAKVPFTSGILIGIGETRLERVDSLLALRDQHRRFGHLQEIIIQNFRAKADTKMSAAPEPDLNELLWTVAVCRIIFGASMSIQAPPNLSPGVLPKLINSGINDWGGVSPVTPDYVNPEAPWPHLDKLAKETAAAGKYLQQRLTIYPAYAVDGQQWLDPQLQTTVLRMIDTEGFPKVDSWSPGQEQAPPDNILLQVSARSLTAVSEDIKAIFQRNRLGKSLLEEDIVRLFQARGDDFSYVCQQADLLRQQVNGDAVTYVVNRNINYTNICYFKCQFCAFSKGKLSENLRGRPYNLGHEEISRRCIEAWQRGATEVCMQGGIHPDYTGETYLDILRTVKAATPEIHIHAFSPLEVWQGAATLDISVENFLQRLQEQGLNTLPGTAAEVLDDEVRAELCPDKINSEQWLSVMEAAHQQGFNTTATIMYGHVERLEHWARHLLKIRNLQEKTGGFTEFVPLPFVHMEAPLYLRGRARSGPTFREAVLMHAVSRIVLSPAIENIQTSWVKMGERGVIACLQAGANDLGGTLMNETITRAAGAAHGQECSPQSMGKIIKRADRTPRQRSTVYSPVDDQRIKAARQAGPLVKIDNTPVEKTKRKTQDRSLLTANG